MMGIRRALVGLCLLLASAAAAATTLTDLDFRQGASGALQVDLVFDEGVPEVRGYRLAEPPRLAIDLMATGNRLAQRRYDLGIGGVAQVTALEAGSRTRLVFALEGALPYRTEVRGDRLRLSIGGGVAPAAATPTARTPAGCGFPPPGR